MPALPRPRTIVLEPMVKRPPAPSRKLALVILVVLGLAFVGACAAMAHRLAQVEQTLAAAALV